MTHPGRRSALLLFALLACAPSNRARSLGDAGSAESAATAPKSAANGTEILWDRYGVPHIYAPDRGGLAYAFGWAQMRNHADLMLRLVAQARGRAAEYLGPDYLEDDRWVWTLELPAHASRVLDLQPPDMRSHVEAFADGINAFARANPTLVSDSVRGVLPVTSSDIFAHMHRVQYARFLSSRQGTRNVTRAWAERGSNAWAIAPRRSASGNTLLLANPHLPWDDLFTWIEAQYAAPGVNVYGGAIVLSPVLNIAFNEHLAWTHTVNTQDGEDHYELTLSGDGYLWDGAVRPFERAPHVLRVRRPDGSYENDTVRVRRSVHGPVVAEKPGKAIALAVVGLHGPELPGAFAQWWSMGRARSFDEFVAAIRPNQISGQNITYGDRDGRVMMFYGGNTPVRPRGNRAYWSGVVRGDSAATLWTRLHSFDEMPRTVDPPAGWVQNANEPPWWATFPPRLDPNEYPAYLAPRPLGLRPQRSIRLLEEDSSITFDELVTYANSSRMELADRLLDDLLPAANASPDDAVRRAAAILERWDRTSDAASRGGVLFTEWWREYTRRRAGQRPYAVAWSASAPRATPDGLADTALAVAALEAAASSVARKYGAADVPWGDVYRVRRDGVDLPASGAGGEWGVFRVVGYSETDDGKFEVAGGMSFLAAVEFSNPVRARTIIGYGNASRAGSPHRTDQLHLFADRRFKTAWLTRGDVEANLELRERIGVRP